MKFFYLVYLCTYNLLDTFLPKLSGLIKKHGVMNKGIRKWFKVIMVEREQDGPSTAPTSILEVVGRGGVWVKCVGHHTASGIECVSRVRPTGSTLRRTSSRGEGAW